MRPDGRRPPSAARRRSCRQAQRNEAGATQRAGKRSFIVAGDGVCSQNSNELSDALDGEVAWPARDAIHRVAAKLGLAVVPTDANSNPSLTPTVLVPDSQEVAMVPHDCPPSPGDGVDTIIANRNTTEGGVQSSIHNPANAMEDDPPEPPSATNPRQRRAPPSVEALAQQGVLNLILDGIGKINERMTDFETRLRAAEQPNRPQAPPAPQVLAQQPPRIPPSTSSDPRPKRPSTSTKPPQTAKKQPPPIARHLPKAPGEPSKAPTPVRDPA